MRKKIVSLLVMAALVVNTFGCAKTSPATGAPEENIELIEPASGAFTVEKAAYRNLYDVKTTAATVMPYLTILLFSPDRKLRKVRLLCILTRRMWRNRSKTCRIASKNWMRSMLIMLRA